MQIDNAGVLLIQRFEGLRLTRYLDSVGVPTIGFGTTEGDLGHPVPFSCTYAQAVDWLKAGLARTYTPPIDEMIRQGVPINQNQYDALASLSYNVGPGVFGWNIGDALRAHDFVAASADFLHYDLAGGHVLEGLVVRREAERALFDTPVKAEKPPAPADPHHYRWLDDTVRDFGRGRHGSERGLVEEYDRRRPHPRRHVLRLEVLRDDMHYLADRLDTVMREHPRDNGPERREWRRGQLAGRAADRRYV
jgi:lysozyme